MTGPYRPIPQKITVLLLFLSSFALVLTMNGAIPFLCIPTLGQAIGKLGFAESLSRQSFFSLHAVHFGVPRPAGVSFGLSAVLPMSWLLRAGFRPPDAYSIAVAAWLGVALWGAFKLSRALGVKPKFACLTSLLWMSLPVIWWHKHYSMLSLGIALLPFYYWTALLWFQSGTLASGKKVKRIVLLSFSGLAAVFMDGYTFVMFAVATGFLFFSILFFEKNSRAYQLKIVFPVYAGVFFGSVLAYCKFIGASSYPTAPIDFFRGWGVDLTFWLIPSKGVHWLWDTLGWSVQRNARTLFGDYSVWSATFALPMLLAGILSFLAIRKTNKAFVFGFLLMTGFGFYMALGPSLKINSVKTVESANRNMPSESAVMPTGNRFLSEHVPGFRNMRASYRWTALGLFGLWCAICLYAAKERTLRWPAALMLIVLILAYLPNLERMVRSGRLFHSSFSEIDRTLLGDLKQDLFPGETVAFLPPRNDLFVNYLAPKLGIRSYNIGGDKNLLLALGRWPESMLRFEIGRTGGSFEEDVLRLLNEDADAAVLPYFDFLEGAHFWPPELEYGDEMRMIASKLEATGRTSITTRRFYAVVRIKQEGARHAALFLGPNI